MKNPEYKTGRVRFSNEIIGFVDDWHLPRSTRFEPVGENEFVIFAHRFDYDRALKLVREGEAKFESREWERRMKAMTAAHAEKFA